MALSLTLLLLPTSQAERSRKSSVVLNPPTSERTVTAPAINFDKLSPSQDQEPKIQPDAAGLPSVLNSRSALSAALFTSTGGPQVQAEEVSLIANWDGREDYNADRGQKVDDFSSVLLSPNQFVTRTGVSEHTVANGFDENVYYYGDSLGNFFIGTDTNPGVNTSSSPSIDSVRQVNIPQLVNTAASGGFSLPAAGCTDATVKITGLAVNPVADLGDFGACGTIGEVVYVSIQDTGACSGAGIKTRIFAFAVTDGTGVNAATPAGTLQIFFSPLSNNGITVDDDSSLYFHLFDAANVANGAAIFKATEQPRTICATPGRINRVIPSIPPVTLATASPVTGGGVTATNYSGTSTTFGNIVAINAGPENVIYAAVSRSFNAADDAGTRATEGLFTNPAALGATPSMVISFADRAGAFDICSGVPTPPGPNVGGILPIADGVADVAQPPLAPVAGVNNFRVFVLGNGPDIRPVTPATSPIVTSQTLKMNMQVDYSIHAGIVTDETGTVFVLSGAAPAGSGSNPSPSLGEMLAFPDQLPADRRADFIDLRGDAPPNPPASGGNVGDGDSDRFDHLYWVAPPDPSTQTPTGISGLSRGFLRYTNRLAPHEIGPSVTLGQTAGQTIQGDDSTSGTVFFGNFDPGHQVAGGDDQNTPFRGDDNDGAGTPNGIAPINAAQEGGFEFTFGGPVGTAACVWNGFFLNSNGSVTFGAGDTDNTPTVTEFRSGLPKIAAAWTDLNPAARGANFGDFPVQALGFSDINAFKIRFINVPRFSDEACTGSGPSGATNTFAVTLFDDGVGIDENANQPLNPANPIGNNAVPFDLQEGPTDLRWTLIQNVGGISVLVGANPRRDGSGNFTFDYGRMDLLGTLNSRVITGYSIGGLSITNPPGLCETKLGPAAASVDAGPLGVTQGQVGNIQQGLIGEGTEPTIYELFDCGKEATGATQAKSDFNLRFSGNDTPSAASQPNPDRTNVGFFGIGCAPPSNPIGIFAIPDPFVTTPTTTGLTNAIGAVGVNLIGAGMFPNEVTTVCGGPTPLNCSSDPAPPGPTVPVQRPGKTVSTAVTLSVDTNGDGIPESVSALTSVTPLNTNLVKATLSPILPSLPGTAFPLAGSGGPGVFTITTTFTSGDNNIFGPFTRTFTIPIALGTRAPVVLGVSPSNGTCGVPQDLLISGSSFQFTLAGSGTQTATGVFALEEGNPSNRIDATSFTVLNNNQLTARFPFTAASAGKRFRIFVVGPGGTSRNLETLPVGSPVGSPTGNEAGNAIDFSCDAAATNALSFSAANYSITEDCTVAQVTITRSLPSTDPVTVDLSTSDGTAVQKSDYTTTFRTVSFASGETAKTVEIPITEDSFNEANETFNLTLTNPTGGAGLGGQSVATVTILNDDNPPPATNAIDDTPTFVGQLYHDFFDRQGDAPGVAFWIGTITSCGANAACIEQRRIAASAAFFLSVEFQETGYNVIRSQRVAFGKKSSDPATRY
ncbi:MAG: hypothetical protein DMF72_00165, partial [Acidobacteria bacterium]